MPPRSRTSPAISEATEDRPSRARRWSTPRAVAPDDPFAPDANALYRLFNPVGALLYVGISDHPRRRFGQHFDEKPWWPEVDRWTVEWFPSRAAAEADELRAIREEVPAFNLRDVPLAGDEVDLHGAWLSHFRRRRPTRDDLAELFLNVARIESLRLWPDARLPYTHAQAVELYEWSRGQAAVTDLWAHRKFLASWRAEHASTPGDALPAWNRKDGLFLRGLAKALARHPREPRPKRERCERTARPTWSVRKTARVGAETFAGMNGLQCRATTLPVHQCDCHSRHIVSAFEERRFGLLLGAPYGAPARLWKVPLRHRITDAVGRYLAA